MLKFIFGIVLGYVVARMLRQDYVDPKRFENNFADMQKRAESVMNESRRILEETRHELSSAFEAGRSSVQEKAERIRTAATEPEHKPEPASGHNTIQQEATEITEMPRPSKIE
jgi:hypothetical protein